MLEQDMSKNQKALTYNSYKSMLNRCTNLNASDYKRYGGRGITICDRWAGPNGFFFFCKDMGIRPPDKTLDRIDNNKGYFPENCRWASKKEQQRNRRNNHFVSLNGKKITLIEAAEKLHIKMGTVRSRITRGMSDIEALLTPIRSDNPLERKGLISNIVIAPYKK